MGEGDTVGPKSWYPHNCSLLEEIPSEPCRLLPRPLPGWATTLHLSVSRNPSGLLGRCQCGGSCHHRTGPVPRNADVRDTMDVR